MTFFEELKRRNVLRVAAAYIVMAWLIIQVAETILPQYGLEHLVRTVITVLAIGFLPAIILAWALEWTTEGIKVDTGATTAAGSDTAIRAGRKFDRIVIVILTIALAWFIFDKIVPPAPDVHYSIAVLPFKNESPDAIPDYLPDGLASEVRDLLAKLPQLLVIERSSAFSFKGQDLEYPEIGRQLGVTHFLTGAVTQLGNNIRVSARLLDAASGESLWRKAYTGTFGDIFAIQGKIASDVTTSFELTGQASLHKSTPTTYEVLALTLQAKQLWYDGLQSADVVTMSELLDEALAIDANYTPALFWKMYALWPANNQGLISDKEADEQWLKLAGRILAIEPDNPSVHNMFAWEALYSDRNLQAAASSYARALKGAPNDGEILRLTARFALLIGREDDAIAMIDRAMAVDPLCSLCLYEASRIYMSLGRLDKAVSLRERFVRLHGGGHHLLGIMKLLQGKTEEAVVIFRDVDTGFSESGAKNDGRAHAGLAMAFHDLDRHEESDEQLAIFLEKYADDDPRAAAKIHAWRGEKDEAFEWFHRADRIGDDREGMLMANPVFKNLHNDPRWTEILEARGMTKQQLAALDFPVELLTRYRDE